MDRLPEDLSYGACSIAKKKPPQPPVLARPTRRGVQSIAEAHLSRSARRGQAATPAIRRFSSFSASALGWTPQRPRCKGTQLAWPVSVTVFGVAPV